jgi:hypothetical protein
MRRDPGVPVLGHHRVRGNHFDGDLEQFHGLFTGARLATV